MEIPNINITEFFFQGTGMLLFKIPILILLFVYIVFLFIVFSRIKALNRAVTIVAAHASQTIQLFALVQLLLAISLFLITIVIV
jgi:hypothetical protein